MQSAVAGTIAIYFLGLPDWYIYLWGCYICGSWGNDTVWELTKRMRIKEKINFFFRIQTRNYETNFGKVGIYTKDEFIQKQKRKTRNRRKEKN